MRVGRANGGDWLRLGEAAHTLGVSLSTLRRWSDSGKLRCYRSAGGHRRYRSDDVTALLGMQAGPARGVVRAPGGAEPSGAQPGPASARAMTALSALARAAAEGAGVTSCLFGLSVGADLVQILADHSPDGATRAAADGATVPHRLLPAAAQAMRTGRRLVIADLGSTNLLSTEEADVYSARGERAILALPLIVDGLVAGAMELADSRAPRSFTGPSVAFAQFMARQAATVLAGRRGAREDLPLHPAIAADWTSLTRGGDMTPPGDWPTGGAVGHRPGPYIAVTGPQGPANDVAEELEPALNALRETIGAHLCAIYRIEGGVASVASGATTRPIDAAGWHLDERPAAALAVRERRVVVTPDDARLATQSASSHQEAPNLPSVLFAALSQRERVVGLLEVGADAEQLAAAAPLVTIAAGLFAAVLGGDEAIAHLQRRFRDLGAVLQVGLEDTSLLGSEETLRSVAEHLAALTATPVADIYALEGDTLRAITSVDGGHVDDEWEGVVIPLRRYPCSRLAVETGKSVLIGDLDDPRLNEEGRYSLEKWGYRSQLTLPLVAGARVLGLLELSDYVPRDFTPHLDLARGLGHVAAHALEVAALQEQVERRTRVLGELVELGALTSRSHDLDLLVRRAAARILTVIEAANCDIFRTVEAGLLCMASFDRSGCDERPVGNLMDIASYPTVVSAANAHQVLVISSPDDPLLSEGERRVYREFGFASEVCVPLVANEELYGLIDIYDTRERDYTEYLSFLRSAALMLAGAFENARLYEQLERRTTILSELVEVGELAAQTRDQRNLLAAVAERLRRTIQAADCRVFILQDQQLRCLVATAADGLDERVAGTVVAIRRFPATAMAAHAQEAVVVANLDDPRLTDEERRDMGKYGFESELCIPLVVDERVIGLIDVFDTRPRDYREYLDFLKSVGQIVAGALGRAVPAASAGCAADPPT